MYKYLNHIYNPLYTLFIIPIGLSVFLIVADYLLLPKNTIQTSLSQANVYSHLKGNPCKASINIQSQWGHNIFETKTVSKSICNSSYKEIEITHTMLLRRWLLLSSPENKHYFVDKTILNDIIFLAVAILSLVGALNGKLKHYFKNINFIIYIIPLGSVYYLYTYLGIYLQ